MAVTSRLRNPALLEKERETILTSHSLGHSSPCPHPILQIPNKPLCYRLKRGGQLLFNQQQVNPSSQWHSLQPHWLIIHSPNNIYWAPATCQEMTCTVGIPGETRPCPRTWAAGGLTGRQTRKTTTITWGENALRDQCRMLRNQRRGYKLSWGWGLRRLPRSTWIWRN